MATYPNTTTANGTVEQIDGRYVLRYERHLPHSMDRVWAALTEQQTQGAAFSQRRQRGPAVDNRGDHIAPRCRQQLRRIVAPRTVLSELVHELYLGTHHQPEPADG